MNKSELVKNGFEGFYSIDHLINTECYDVPKIKGIYLVINENEYPTYLEESVGGHFKSINPTVNVVYLKSKWVEETIVVYIGQAGGGKSKASLYSRLKQYMKFGKGDSVGHWGGRYIWQLKNNRHLLVCWKPIKKDNSRDIEKNLIHEFKDIYNKRPFANISG